MIWITGLQALFYKFVSPFFGNEIIIVINMDNIVHLLKEKIPQNEINDILSCKLKFPEDFFSIRIDNLLKMSLIKTKFIYLFLYLFLNNVVDLCH